MDLHLECLAVRVLKAYEALDPDPGPGPRVMHGSTIVAWLVLTDSPTVGEGIALARKVITGTEGTSC